MPSNRLQASSHIRMEAVVRLCSEVLHRRSSRGDGWHKGKKGKLEPKIQVQPTKIISQATKALSLSARRLPVPQRIATQNARSRTATGVTTTLQGSDAKHCLDWLEPCIDDLLSRICSQGLPETSVGLYNDARMTMLFRFRNNVSSSSCRMRFRRAMCCRHIFPVRQSISWILFDRVRFLLFLSFSVR